MSGGLRAVRVEHPSQPTTGWGRWHVVDDDGQVIGGVDEWRAWQGSAYGPPVYRAVHNAGMVPWRACWSDEQGTSTVPAAVAVLAAHLRDVHGEQVDGG